VAETGAQSIGLFRTELQFMVAQRFPRMGEQYELYKAVLDALPGRSVTFRTLDIGGDKVLPYMSALEEPNPALGWRAIRIGLDRPALLRSQLRAMLRASAGRELRVMFPMVAMLSEFRAARALLDRELAHLRRHQRTTPATVRLGVMLEVPSLIWQLQELLAEVDFISVGSNDLMQYLFAVDRDNKRVAHRFDCLSPPALRALGEIAAAGAAANKPVTLCGEMAGVTLEALALVAIGYRGLSMSPANIGPVKAMILALDAAEARRFVEERLQRQDAPVSLRADLQAFAEERGVPL
jgi:phosphotransferase system enzyme I (PtsP)